MVTEDCVKIVTWNCHHGENVFLKKIEKLKDETKAQIFIVQECPDIREISTELEEMELKPIDWDGDKDGVGICVKKDYSKKVEITECPRDEGGYYVSCKIEDKLNILGVWVKDRINPENQKYADLFQDYLTKNEQFLDHINVIAGDLNIDRKFQANKTDEIYEFLRLKGFVSAYHHTYPNEKYGKEENKTYYLKKTSYKDQNHAFVKYNGSTHLDYMFLSEKIIIENVELGSKTQWIFEGSEWINNKPITEASPGRSDHVPLIVDIKYK